MELDITNTLNYQKEFPDDCADLWKFLTKHGNPKFAEHGLAYWYHKFSDDNYCANWLILSSRTKYEFAHWLEEQNMWERK